MIDQLKQYALDNYEAGGHWAFETFDDSRYIAIINRTKTLDEAKAALKDWCNLVSERESDCAWDGPDNEVTPRAWT